MLPVFSCTKAEIVMTDRLNSERRQREVLIPADSQEGEGAIDQDYSDYETESGKSEN